MLIVYAYNAPKPKDCFDLSYEPLTSFADTAMGILEHHSTATLWFGYLEGWMLSPHEETRLRTVIREFECHVVTREPLSFSQAWKNEIRVLHLHPDHGVSDINNNGSIIHSERSTKHKSPSGVSSVE